MAARILGIDPGWRNLGLAVVDIVTGECVAADTIAAAPGMHDKSGDKVTMAVFEALLTRVLACKMYREGIKVVVLERQPAFATRNVVLGSAILSVVAAFKLMGIWHPSTHVFSVDAHELKRHTGCVGRGPEGKRKAVCEWAMNFPVRPGVFIADDHQADAVSCCAYTLSRLPLTRELMPVRYSKIPTEEEDVGQVYSPRDFDRVNIMPCPTHPEANYVVSRSRAGNIFVGCSERHNDGEPGFFAVEKSTSSGSRPRAPAPVVSDKQSAILELLEKNSVAMAYLLDVHGARLEKTDRGEWCILTDTPPHPSSVADENLPPLKRARHAF